MLSSFKRQTRLTSSIVAPKLHCQICQIKFQRLISTEHTCKRCLRAVCDKCKTVRAKVFMADGAASMHKLCTLCKREDQLLDFLIQQNHLVFQVSSKIAEEWFKKANKEKINFQDIINEYQEMKFVTNANTIKFKSQSIAICYNLFRQYNFSLRQFMGKMTQDVRNENITTAITNVTIALYGYLTKMPYIQEIVFLVAFILCFCSQFQCYFIISRFIEKIYPQYFRLENMNNDNLMVQELKMLTDMYKTISKKVEKREILTITTFLQHRFLGFIKSLTVNMACVAVSFYLLDDMFTTNSYITLYKGIVSLVFNVRDTIVQGIDYQLVEAKMVSHITLENVKNNMILFDRAKKKFQMERQFFDSAEHKRLHEKYKQLQALYQKSDQKYNQLQTKYKAMAKQHQKVTHKLSESLTKTMTLQQQLINLGDKLVMIEEYDRFKEQNQLFAKRYKLMSQELSIVQKKYEDLNKKYTMEQITRNMYLKMQEDYQRQIVDLKTKNQVYQIEKLANDINFRTEYIDEQFQQKNKRIAELQKQNNDLNTQIQFYRNTRPSQSFLRNGNDYRDSRQNILDWPSSQVNGQKNSYKKLMDANKQVIDKLKTDLAISQEQRTFLAKQVKKLSQTVQHQQIQLQLISQINDFISQIPEEINYVQNLDDLQKIIQNESNLHKKTQLQSILVSFKKCVYEVRYRTIDAKLKQNKIKEEKVIQAWQKAPKTQTEYQEYDNHSRKSSLDITDHLSWFGNAQMIQNLNKKVLKKQQCLIM